MRSKVFCATKSAKSLVKVLMKPVGLNSTGLRIYEWKIVENLDFLFVLCSPILETFVELWRTHEFWPNGWDSFRVDLIPTWRRTPRRSVYCLAVLVVQAACSERGMYPALAAISSSRCRSLENSLCLFGVGPPKRPI